MTKPSHITILGGGPAGLAVGYYAKKKDLPFTIYEVSNCIGGNSTTLRHGDFLYDSGAHRLHDKDAEVTKELLKLLGEDLKEINIPSKIYDNGKFVKFPLLPFDLMQNMGLLFFAKATVALLHARLNRNEPNENFENFALYTYGKIIAERFLLNYSQKLWGKSCNRLSTEIAGKRLKGLNLKSFIVDSIFKRDARTEHLEGLFYYPNGGIYTISQKLAEVCKNENIKKNSEITKILHNYERIQAVEINGNERIETDELVSTLPLDFFIQAMEPEPPKEILFSAQKLHYRNIVLVALFLDKESVTDTATVYFPDIKFPFTRIYEPKNRNITMSPEGKTSLIAEIPCQKEDYFWSMKDDKLIQLILSQLIDTNLIRKEEVIDASVNRLNYAYPILETGFEEKLQKINSFLNGFNNLKLSGRNGRFVYSWIHNMMRFGKEIIDDMVSKTNIPNRT